LLRNSLPENVLNCDETCWRLYPNGILTWAETGSENVAIEIPGDEKASITAMATITADHQKLPLYLIAQGENKQDRDFTTGKGWDSRSGPFSEQMANGGDDEASPEMVKQDSPERRDEW
jgi:hypothetical protein